MTHIPLNPHFLKKNSNLFLALESSSYNRVYYREFTVLPLIFKLPKYECGDTILLKQLGCDFKGKSNNKDEVERPSL